MSELRIDPDRARTAAGMHEDVGGSVVEALDAVPTAVDGGIASEVIVTIMSQVSESLGTVADLSTIVGGEVRDAAADADAVDENVARVFTEIAVPDGDDG